jgi:hypothetical protein
VGGVDQELAECRVLDSVEDHLVFGRIEHTLPPLDGRLTEGVERVFRQQALSSRPVQRALDAGDGPVLNRRVPRLESELSGDVQRFKVLDLQGAVMIYKVLEVTAVKVVGQAFVIVRDRAGDMLLRDQLSPWPTELAGRAREHTRYR